MRRVRISFFRFFLLFVRFICRFLNRARVILRGNFYRFLNDRVCQITATNYESFSRYLFCTLFDRQRRITVYILLYATCRMHDDLTYVYNTWSLNVSAKRKRKKKGDEENRGTHPPSVSPSLPPANTILSSLPLSPCVSLFFPFPRCFFSRSSGRWFLLSVLLNTNDRTLNYLRGEPATCVLSS